MTHGKTPSSTLQAAAMKVVRVNRLKRGLGKDVLVEDFRIEELGGRAGPLVFGPLSVFSGNVSLRARKPLNGITLIITFTGQTELDKVSSPFITVAHQLHAGDLQPGLRTFLFAFDFPHINLPPTSERPKVSYVFVAKLDQDYSAPGSPSGDSVGSKRHEPVRQYTSKPLNVIFIPYVDPTLETPLVSRKPSMRKRKSREKNSFHKPQSRSAQTLQPLDAGATPSQGSPAVTKPKLTLTTADLDSAASSNSTPAIDKPHPSALSSAITRTMRVTDDGGATLARLTVDMPNSRFLPGDEIFMKVSLQVRDGVTIPKGLSVRVIEKRYLARQVADKEKKGTDPDKNDSEGEDEDDIKFKMQPVGKEQLRVLAGKKLVLYPAAAETITSESKEEGTNNAGPASSSKASTYSDLGLVGGLHMEQPITLLLPPFQTFINDFLLPSASLPLGDPRGHDYIPDSLVPATHTPKLVINGNGKGKAAETVFRTTQSYEKTRDLFFKVSHTVQVTIPMGSSTHWYNKASTATMDDLEVNVPIILGNKNPKQAASRTRARRWESMSGSHGADGSSTGSRSLSRSASDKSGKDAGKERERERERDQWREGQRFLTMRETETRPGFVVDQLE